MSTSNLCKAALIVLLSFTLCAASTLGEEVYPGVIRIKALHSIINMPANVTELVFADDSNDKGVFAEWQMLSSGLVVNSIKYEGKLVSVSEDLMTKFSLSEELAVALKENKILALRRSFEGTVPYDTIAWNKYRHEYVKVPDVSVYYDINFSEDIDPFEVVELFSEIPGLDEVEVAGIPQPACVESWNPNDPLLDQQWYLDQINTGHGSGGSSVKCAWSRLPVYYRGKLILIGFVDEGIPAQGEINVNFDLEAKTDPRSTMFRGVHGTQVAGVAAAYANNMHLVAGVAPDAKVIVVYGADVAPPSGSISDAFEFFYNMADTPPVISVSMRTLSGGGAQTDWAKKLVNEKGVVIVAAAGNLSSCPGGDPCINYPAFINDWVIAVGGKKQNGDWWDGSNHGCLSGCGTYGPVPHFVDLIAPAVDMLVINPSNTYSIRTGTSGSAPIVSGLVALAFGHNAYVPVDSMRAALEETTTILELEGDPLKIGNGAVDGDAFIERIQANFYCRIIGDVNLNCAGPDVLDLTYIIDNLFRGGPYPVFPNNADVNGDGSYNIVDLTYLIDYIWRGGADPVRGCVNSDFGHI